MKAPPDLVLHVGLPHTGGDLLDRAFRTCRRQLRDNAVAYVGAPTTTLNETTNMNTLSARVAAERRRSAVRRDGAQTVLVSDETLLGTSAEPSLGRVEDLITALAPARVSIVLILRRQDRALEFDHLHDVLDGGSAGFETRREQPDPGLDYLALAEALAALPGVQRVHLLPLELSCGAPERLAGQLLAAVGLGEQIDLRRVPSLSPDPVVTARGLTIARAMNAEVSAADEHRLIRDYVLKGFPTEPDQFRLLEDAERQHLLAGYAERNRQLFGRFLPEADPDAYRDDPGTETLTSLTLQAEPMGPARLGPVACALGRADVLAVRLRSLPRLRRRIGAVRARVASRTRP